MPASSAGTPGGRLSALGAEQESGGQQESGALPGSKLKPGPAYAPRRIVLFLLTAVCVVGSLALASSFVPAITWAVALSVATRLPYRWLERKSGRSSLAAATAVAIVLLLLVIPFVVLGYNVGSQLLEVVGLVRSGAAQDWAQRMLTTYPRINELFHRLEGTISLQGSSQAAAGYVAGQLQALLAGSVRTLTQLAIMLFTLFFLYRDGDKARAAFLSALPVRPAYGEDLLRRMSETITASLGGSLTIAAIQGSLGGLMFFVLAVPQAFLWAFVMGMLALIPSLGTFLVWMPVAVFLALSGHPVKATILVAWGLGVISTVDNLLYPTLVSSRLRLHTLPIFFAVLGGITLFGLSGLVLGPLLLTTTIALLHLWSPAVLPLPEAGRSRR